MIFLVGARASGKTTVGRQTAAMLGWDFQDTDHYLAHTEGMSVANYIAACGWDAFRAAESAAVRAITETPLTKGHTGRVVATGGGIVLAAENRHFLHQRGIVCYLYAKAALLVARLTVDPQTALRPPLTTFSLADEVTDVLRQRDPLYREAAHHVLEASLPPEAVARMVADYYTLSSGAPYAR